jgi:indole-3-glycerol phosphate synthase
MRTPADNPARIDTADILARIVAHKRAMLPLRRILLPPAALEAMPGFGRARVSLADALREGRGSGIIAEFKRRSPSKGTINDRCEAAVVAAGYARHGASAVSVLTDEVFFGGTAEDLMAVREAVGIPLLRKDFIVDEYQILEARALGADLVLLIAACLTPSEVRRLAAFAGSLGLETLLELHAEEELGHVCDEVDLIGINNRDLRTFSVDMDRSLRMAERLSGHQPLVAESGIDSPGQVRLFRDHGFRGFLMGERFMREADPAEAFRAFMDANDKTETP